MRARVKRWLWWTPLLLLLYPVSCGVFMVACYVDESGKEKKTMEIWNKIHKGMTPSEVEETLGLPSEVTLPIMVDDVRASSTIWGVSNYHVGVNFKNGRSSVWWVRPPEPSPVRQFFVKFYTWWIPRFGDGDVGTGEFS